MNILIPRLRLQSETAWSIVAIVASSAFILVSFWLPFSWPLYVICFGLAAIAIIVTPEAGLLTVIVATMIFERWFTLQPIELFDQVIKFYPIDLVIIITLVSVLIRRLFGPHLRLSDRPFGGALWLWVVVISMAGILSLFDETANPELIGSTVKNFALYGVMYWLAINIVRTAAQFHRFIGALVFGAVAIIPILIYGLIVGQGLWAEYVPLSTAGTRFLGEPHSFYVAGLFILLINWLVARPAWGRREITALMTILAWGVGIVASLQRHLWLGLVAVSGILIASYQAVHRRQLLRIAGLGLIAVALAVVVTLWWSSWQVTTNPLENDLLRSAQLRVVSLFSDDGSDSSTVWRLTSWYRAWQLWQEHWLFGIGFGHLISFSIGELDFSVEIRELHNNFIGLVLQLGLIGLGLALYLVSRIGLAFWRYQGRLRGSQRQWFVGFFALAVLFLWSANFSVYFDVNALSIFFWLSLAGMRISQRLGLAAY